MLKVSGQWPLHGRVIEPSSLRAEDERIDRRLEAKVTDNPSTEASFRGSRGYPPFARTPPRRPRRAWRSARRYGNECSIAMNDFSAAIASAQHAPLQAASGRHDPASPSFLFAAPTGRSYAGHCRWGHRHRRPSAAQSDPLIPGGLVHARSRTLPSTCSRARTAAPRSDEDLPLAHEPTGQSRCALFRSATPVRVGHRAVGVVNSPRGTPNERRG